MNFYESTLQWVKHMLLSDMIRLKDVPRNVRTGSGSIHVAALRTSNLLSCERFVQDLKILAQDIYSLSDDQLIKSDLVSILQTYLDINDHEGEEALESFQKDLYPEVLLALQRGDQAVQKMFSEQLGESSPAQPQSGIGINVTLE